MVRHDVTDQINALEAERPVAIVLDNVPIALVKTQTSVFAVSNTCTHANANLADGFVMENWIECPLHQARYDLASGELLDGPFCPSLPTFEIEQEEDRFFISLDT